MLPDSENVKIPIGSYKFQVMKEPDARRKTGQGGKGFTTILFILKATNGAGEVFEHAESILAFEARYDDLLIALGATEIKGRLSGKTIDPIGMTFNAEIAHEPDKNDPTKTWARMVNIGGIEDDDKIEPPTKKDLENELNSGDTEGKDTEEEDEVPF